MVIRPLWDNVIVKKVEAPKTTTSLILTTFNVEESNYAEVVAVGRGKRLANGSVREPEIRPGDRIVLEDGAGREIVVDGEKLYFVKSDQILAVL